MPDPIKSIYYIKGVKKDMKTRYIIYGAKWFDKVNGNTYNNAKIYDIETGETYYKGFEYGYGNCYYHDAIEYIKTNIDPEATNEQFKDFGSGWYLKKEVRQGWF